MKIVDYDISLFDGFTLLIDTGKKQYILSNKYHYEINKGRNLIQYTLNKKYKNLKDYRENN